MADIFDEVEEGVRQDRMAELWRKYGWLAWLAGAALVGGVGLNEYLNHQKAQSIEANATQFEAGLDQLTSQDYQAAGDTLAALLASGDEIAPAAAQYLAQVRLDGNGDEVAAADTLMASITGEVDTSVEKLALIKAAYLKADTMTRVEVQEFLGGLPNEASAFGALALELVAAKAMEEGDFAFARSEFNLIRVSANVPPGVLRRADQALAAMPVMVVPEAFEAPAEPEGVPTETDTQAEESPE